MIYPLKQFEFMGELEFALPPINELSNLEAKNFVENWMRKELPCVAGRRETIKNRYMVEIATRDSVPKIFNQYCENLQNGSAIACLFVFNTLEFIDNRKTVSEVFYFLAEQMQKISRVSTSDLANGKALTKEIELACPVTGELTKYDDFECIAFCPQSNNPGDLLYDPLMAMPLPAVNLSSDMYAYSNFVADMTKQRFGKTIKELSSDRIKTEKILFACVDQWQRIACKTIRNYESLTDTSLCPVHVNENEDKWIAAHKDPAFAEQVKEVHTHELPVIYAERITQNWLDYFYEDTPFCASGLARDGEAA